MSTPPADTGLILGPLENARTLLAACPSWQEWTRASEIVGDASAKAIKARTHTYLMEPSPEQGDEYSKDELEIRRPCCVVDWFTNANGAGGGSVVADQVALDTFTAAANFFMTFEADTPNELIRTNARALMWFVRKVEAVCSELMDLQGTDDYLMIQQPQLFRPPRRSPREDKERIGDYWDLTLKITTSSYPT